MASPRGTQSLGVPSPHLVSWGLLEPQCPEGGEWAAVRICGWFSVLRTSTFV